MIKIYFLGNINKRKKADFISWNYMILSIKQLYLLDEACLLPSHVFNRKELVLFSWQTEKVWTSVWRNPTNSKKNANPQRSLPLHLKPTRKYQEKKYLLYIISQRYTCLFHIILIPVSHFCMLSARDIYSSIRSKLWSLLFHYKLKN